jgi:hypothetical protein
MRGSKVCVHVCVCVCVCVCVSVCVCAIIAVALARSLTGGGQGWGGCWGDRGSALAHAPLVPRRTKNTHGRRMRSSFHRARSRSHRPRFHFFIDLVTSPYRLLPPWQRVIDRGA